MSYETLKSTLDTIQNLGNAAAVVSWDQQVNMPQGGNGARARQMGALSKLIHEMSTSDDLGEQLDAAEASLASFDYDSDEASMIRLARRQYDRATKIPTELAVKISETTTQAHQVWVKARQDDDFAAFAPILKEIMDLQIEAAEHIGYNEHIYDAMLDGYESGMKTSEVKRIFEEIRQPQVDLVAAIQENKDKTSDDILRVGYPADQQRAFGEMVIQKFGYDFNRGRQDEAVHPFATSFSRNDVRITTRFSENWLPSALFGTFHESGHGMYEQGIAEQLDGTILCRGTSLGVHESQSRLWENVIGRSRPFWQHFYPQLQATFPSQLGDVDLETFYRSINHSQPSLIRVEADEVTYNLHIMVRFDIEVGLLEGTYKVEELPDVWNSKYEEYLGITPPSAAQGVLQDIHWSAGLVGYFATYSLGNLLSVQFYEKALEANPEIPSETAKGEFGTLHSWLQSNIYQHGSKFTATEIVERVTGGSIQSGPYLNYLTEKYSDIYGL